MLLSRGYKNVISGFQCVTTATKQSIRCLKEFYVVVKRLQYRMLSLPSFGIFLPSSVKSVLTMKIIIKSKKEKRLLHALCTNHGVVPCNKGIFWFKGVVMTTLGNPYFQNVLYR